MTSIHTTEHFHFSPGRKYKLKKSVVTTERINVPNPVQKVSGYFSWRYFHSHLSTCATSPWLDLWGQCRSNYLCNVKAEQWGRRLHLVNHYIYIHHWHFGGWQEQMSISGGQKRGAVVLTTVLREWRVLTISPEIANIFFKTAPCLKAYHLVVQRSIFQVMA